jgi:hypothetical protein
MTDLKPWVYGPFEMLKHAEGHLKANSDFDKRMALISYDNTIEVAITTFLLLHPSQRNGRTYPRNQVDQWMINYHSKLDFLEQHIASLNLPMNVTRDEIIWYHNLRNELYHSGNGMVPEERSLKGARAAAIWVFSQIFEVDAESLLQSPIPSPTPVSQSSGAQLSAQMHFLQTFIEFEKTLNATPVILGVAPSSNKPLLSVREAWSLFSSQADILPKSYDHIVKASNVIRNNIVHGKSVRQSDAELLAFSKALSEVADFIRNTIGV